MTKIIKLTESQLRDIVTKAVNEQRNSPNASPAAKEIWNKLSVASGNGGLGGTNETALISAITLIKSVQLFVEVDNMMRGPSSIGNYKSIVKLLNGELELDNLKEFQQIQAILKKAGVILTAQTEKSPRTNDIVLKPGTIRIVAGKTPVPTPPVKTDPNKPTYRECTGFPIKYGCKQTEVGRIQQCLGLKVDYSFGPSTLVKLVDYSTQRNTQASMALQKQYIEIGVSQGAYNLIIEKCKKVIKQKTKPKPGEKPVVDTRTPMADIAPLKARQIQQLPVNIDIPTLQSLPSPGVDPIRKDYILKNITNRGFDKIYKGDELTQPEKDWIQSYLGTQINKDKMKAGGQEKLRLPNP
jgi:hypothetical protein